MRHYESTLHFQFLGVIEEILIQGIVLSHVLIDGKGKQAIAYQYVLVETGYMHIDSRDLHRGEILL